MIAIGIVMPMATLLLSLIWEPGIEVCVCCMLELVWVAEVIAPVPKMTAPEVIAPEVMAAPEVTVVLVLVLGRSALTNVGTPRVDSEVLTLQHAFPFPSVPLLPGPLRSQQ